MTDKLNIESKYFDSARASFNEMMQNLLNQIRNNQAEYGTITLKTKVVMEQRPVVEETGRQRIASIPTLKYEVKITVPVTDKIEDDSEVGKELTTDDRGIWYLSPVPVDGQMNIGMYK